MKSVSPPHTVSPERAKHLERNRIAANKCRERKKRENKQIERRLNEETEKKEVLLAQLNCLQEEVWDLKNIIFQHTECEDHQINTQLRRMTQSVLHGQFVSNIVVPDMSSSPTASTKTWSDESVADEGNMNINVIDPGAYNQKDWTNFPKVTNGVLYDNNGLADSIFDNFIEDSLYT
ncbi:hypothetical protein N7455_006079 [Penicillium solitum]|uniref:uncharacterized protein n=1 Tax=Penicillium solitum TaxID=60172 RepID=UPI0032C406D0|nr:transcriptional regulator family: bZIP [Penicillium roqueforti]KAI2739625.1 transcriptional regulator family: bZIP [Penicillium roqueforti]KAI3162528.1 transcriptional regulator family: bZIP [Penicillium roqueforti]KAJ5862011.1 hypothetical protein N7455_006079 [Penicillium solitum]